MDRKGPRAQTLLRAEPRGLMLLLGRPPQPRLQRAGRRASRLLRPGVCRGPLEGRECKGHPATHPSRLAEVITGKCSATGAGPTDMGTTRGGGCLTPREQQTTPFKKGLLQKREASHMCKTHLVKINTGFVFSIKNKNKKNQ